MNELIKNIENDIIKCKEEVFIAQAKPSDISRWVGVWAVYKMALGNQIAQAKLEYSSVFRVAKQGIGLVKPASDKLADSMAIEQTENKLEILRNVWEVVTDMMNACKTHSRITMAELKDVKNLV